MKNSNKLNSNSNKTTVNKKLLKQKNLKIKKNNSGFVKNKRALKLKSNTQPLKSINN